MTNFRKLIVLAAVIASSAAGAQSQYSIPNALMRPQGITGAQDIKHGSAQQAPQGDGAASVQVPPLPAPISPASLPGATGFTNAPGSDTVIRETLATFSVTAIVGDRAVLRNNVGSASSSPTAQGGVDTRASGGGNTGMMAPGSSAAAPQAARQAVIRVQSGTPVYVSGVQLLPTVMSSRVEFRIAGKQAVVSTVMLESQSSYGYIPPTAQREQADPAVATRVAPVLSGLSSDGSGALPSSNGGSAGNGQASAQH